MQFGLGQRIVMFRFVGVPIWSVWQRKLICSSGYWDLFIRWSLIIFGTMIKPSMTTWVNKIINPIRVMQYETPIVCIVVFKIWYIIVTMDERKTINSITTAMFIIWTTTLPVSSTNDNVVVPMMTIPDIRAMDCDRNARDILRFANRSVMIWTHETLRYQSIDGDERLSIQFPRDSPLRLTALLDASGKASNPR